LLSHAMLESLESAVPLALADAREVALADMSGSPLWLRAEPGDNPAMSAALAAELDLWSATCGR
jgi:hypothetical protein